jgi:aldose 1-epimerase
MTDVLHLQSQDGSANASIQTSLGFNLFDWRVDGEPLLWADPDFASGTQRPSGSGIPILFPFPGRVEGGEFEWEGKNYKIDSDDGRGNAIHGFVYDRPWSAQQLSGDRVRGTFRAKTVDPKILDQWPADFEIEVEYALHASSLVSEFTVRALETPLPCGLGLHPYFRADISADAKPVGLTSPLNQRWPLENMNPTGTQETDDRFSQGAMLNQVSLDDVLSFEKATSESIEYRSTLTTSRSIVVRHQDDFPHCVLYTPPHREAVCIEPYSCIPNAIKQVGTAREDYGLRILQPGEVWRSTVTYEVI